MPFPSLGTERARPDIADSLLGFDVQGNMIKMVALQIFPVREVSHPDGTFGLLTGKQQLKKVDGVPSAAPGFAFQRASRADYQRDDMSFTEKSWKTREFGLEGLVDERESRAYRDYFHHASVVAQRVSNLLAVERELRVSALLFDTATYTTAAGLATNVAATPSRQWNNLTSADPIKQVMDARIAVRKKIGKFPNAIVMNAIAFELLIHTDDIRTRVHAQGAGSPDRPSMINKQMVAQALNLDEVIVGEAVYDPTNPNDPFTPTDIWTPHAAVFYKATTEDLAENCIGRTFHWAEDDSMINGFVEEYRDPKKRGNIIRVRQEEQNLPLDPNCSHMLQNIYVLP